MKTKSIINKFRKAGIEFTNKGRSYSATHNGILVTFNDQDGSVIVLHTTNAKTYEADSLCFAYTDCGYGQFHETMKSALQAVA